MMKTLTLVATLFSLGYAKPQAVASIPAQAAYSQADTNWHQGFLREAWSDGILSYCGFPPMSHCIAGQEQQNLILESLFKTCQYLYEEQDPRYFEVGCQFDSPDAKNMEITFGAMGFCFNKPKDIRCKFYDYLSQPYSFQFFEDEQSRLNEKGKAKMRHKIRSCKRRLKTSKKRINKGKYKFAHTIMERGKCNGHFDDLFAKYIQPEFIF